MHHAVKVGSPEIVRLLLSNHASVNLGDENNVIPLHTASSLGYMDIARMLLESGKQLFFIN